MEQSITVDIDAAPDRVWAILSDVARWPEWTETVTSVSRLDDGPFAVGSRARVEQPRLPTTEYVVTEHVPGRSFTWQAAGPGVRTTGTHVIEDLGSGRSRVRLAITQAGPVGVVMGRLFLKGLTDRYLATEAAGLKARSESPA